MDDLLQVQSLNKRFGGVIALDDISFELSKSHIYGLIGPNGSGKTTLLNVISGIYRPDGGRILYKNKPIHGKAPHSIAKMGVARTFQTPREFWNLTVRQNILAVLPSDRRNNREVDRILSTMGLGELGETSSRNLGYGQKKQLEFARALALDADLIMLDEPMAGLDVPQIESMSKSITKIHNEFSKTFLIVEHHLEELMKLAEWVIVLDNGLKIAEGDPKSIRDDAKVYAAYFGST